MKRTALSALVLATLSALPASAASLQLGILDCEVEGGPGYVIASNKGLTCTFKPSSKAYSPEVYSGLISKLGVDIGVTQQSSISWAVLAADWDDYDPGLLAGRYFGASAEAAVVTGGGANLLVGGSRRAFTLQPLSVQTQTGLNLAVAVTSMELYTSLK